VSVYEQPRARGIHVMSVQLRSLAASRRVSANISQSYVRGRQPVALGLSERRRFGSSIANHRIAPTTCLTYPHFWFSLQSFQLRNALVPYIYTAARTAYATGILLVHPLYYEWPDLDAAYSFSQLRGPGIPIQHMYFALIKHPGPFLVPTHCFL